LQLVKQAKDGNHRAQAIQPKIREVILLGGWIGDEKDVSEYETYFREAEKNPPFEGLTWENFNASAGPYQEMLDSFDKFAWPCNAILHCISAYQDHPGYSKTGQSDFPVKSIRYFFDKLPQKKHRGYTFVAGLRHEGNNTVATKDALHDVPTEGTYGTQEREWEFHDNHNAAPVFAAIFRGEHEIKEPSEDEAERLKEFEASQP